MISAKYVHVNIAVKHHMKMQLLRTMGLSHNLICALVRDFLVLDISVHDIANKIQI